MLRGTGVKEKKKEKKSNDIQIHIYVHTQNHANVPLKTYFDGDSNSLWEFKSHAAVLYLPLNRSPIVKQHTCVLISKFHISHSID